jgi:hypothetical protein
MMPGERPFPPAAISALERGHKIEAIKVIRQEWGTDLKDSKAAVDAYIRNNPALAPSLQTAPGQGYLIWLIIGLAAVLAAYYFLRTH